MCHTQIVQFGEYSCRVVCPRFGYPGHFSEAKGYYLHKDNGTISEVRSVPHTHPVFNPVSPTTHSSNATVARGDTISSTCGVSDDWQLECTLAVELKGALELTE